MSLLEEIKKLRELEQLNRKDRVEHGAVYQYHAAKLAPAMLSVLECFREGYAEILATLLDYLESSIGNGEYEYDIAEAACIKSLQKAASLMEQEEREG